MKNRHGMTSLLAWLLVVAMCICAVPIHGAGTQNVALPFQKAENAAADGALPERIPEEIPDSPDHLDTDLVRVSVVLEKPARPHFSACLPALNAGSASSEASNSR